MTRIRRDYTLIGLGLALLIGGELVWRYRQLTTARAAVTLNTRDAAAWQKRAHDAEARVRELTDELAKQRATAGPSPAERSAKRPPAGRDPRELLDNPQFASARAAQQKAALDAHYAALFKALGLSPAQLETLKRLLVDKQNAALEVFAAARALGLEGPESRDALGQLVRNTQAEVEASIRAAIGEEAYATYQDYEAALPARTVVSQLEQRLSYSSEPLTAEQSNELLTLIGAAAPALASGPVAPPVAASVRGFMPSAVITDQALGQAQAILSPTQLQALQQLQAEQQAQLQMVGTRRGRG